MENRDLSITFEKLLSPGFTLGRIMHQGKGLDGLNHNNKRIHQRTEQSPQF